MHQCSLSVLAVLRAFMMMQKLERTIRFISLRDIHLQSLPTKFLWLL
jgi:hypothetical protein